MKKLPTTNTTADRTSVREGRLGKALQRAAARETGGRLQFHSVTVFLNRNCPRTCIQCGIADNSRRWMQTEDWIKAFDNLNKVFGTTFFLFLGTEPLVMGQTMIDIIKWMKSRDLFYGFYSTSPEPLFSKWKDKLIEAGVDNWSAGIDTLPHLESMDPITDKKVRESIVGLKWMAECGITTLAQTTVHRKNLHLLPEIVEWCQDNIPGVMSAFNFIEWRRDERFDFFAPPEDMPELLWTGSDEERAEVKEVMLKMLAMSRVEGRLIQIPDDYLLTAHLHYDKLDVHCKGSIGPSVDSDGTMRLCGYNRGENMLEWNVLDLTSDKFDEFMSEWTEDLNRCEGCHWSFMYYLQDDPAILDRDSGFLQNRWALKPTSLK